MKADFYTRVQADRREAAGIYAEKLAFIRRHTGTGKRVLDVGCNDGGVGALLLAQSNEVHGVDIAEDDLERARERGLIARRVNVEREQLPYEDGFFDVVVLADVIEHVFETDELLRECRRVLAAGGSLVVTTPNIASLGRRAMLLVGLSPFLEYSTELATAGLPSVGHIRYYTARDLRRQLLHHGLQVFELRGDGLNLGLLRLPVGRFVPSLCTNLLCAARAPA